MPAGFFLTGPTGKDFPRRCGKDWGGDICGKGLLGTMSTERIQQAYALARERYAELGVDTEAAIEQLAGIPVSCTAGREMTSEGSKAKKD